MFRIECFVEDARLAPVLHLLAGMVKGLDVSPVTNVEVLKNGHMKAQTEGTLVEMFAQYMDQNPSEEVNAGYAKQFLQTVGRSPKSYSYLLKQAAEAKLVTKADNGRYRRVADK